LKKAEEIEELSVTPEPRRVAQAVLERVRGEFLEMPGLRLTQQQAQRLRALDEASCAALLAELIEAQFLFRTHDGSVMRVERGTPAKAGIRRDGGAIAAA
jgi:hypothetical protein